MGKPKKKKCRVKSKNAACAALEILSEVSARLTVQRIQMDCQAHAKRAIFPQNAGLSPASDRAAAANGRCAKIRRFCLMWVLLKL
ncbi:hypothetical protein [Vandammella animalimorsus]|uniref:hypothetical protein n=1 Tax=Vandammella animalimorsus TaxID=2029117 RepID=UPI0011782B27|nr:hypothetical protein [Vandammella animalimorsus]